eukprot:2997882-Pleurochrysis_carterae.AAC.1
MTIAFVKRAIEQKMYPYLTSLLGPSGVFCVNVCARYFPLLPPRARTVLASHAYDAQNEQQRQRGGTLSE